MPQYINLTGKIFGKLKVLKRIENNKYGSSQWLCICEYCGNETILATGQLTKGKQKSCGCVKKQLCKLGSTKHNMAYSVEYKTWKRMIQRCTNKNNSSYVHYGARGIQVCFRWMTFENFYTDMGKRPSSTHSIDRIDHNGNYTPQNCRWATLVEQNMNRRKPITNTSGIKGVSLNKKTNKWRAGIQIKGKSINLGDFLNKEEAIIARKQAEIFYV